MTRKEAIKWLKTFKGHTGMTELSQAFDVAIEALEQEPCEDAISRAEAIRVASGYCHPANIAKELEKLPSVLPKQKTGEWIPVVSDSLPEDEQEILFRTKTGRVHSGKYYDDDSANQWYSHKDKCRAWNNVVIAWMPLPE